MSTWTAMTRDEKIGAVYRLARKGLPAAQIAAVLATTAPRVHKLARVESISLVAALDAKRREASIDDEDDDPNVSNEGTNQNMWTQPEDVRRRMIYAKARQGARETLERNMKNDNPRLSQQSTARPQQIQASACVKLL